jgi:hypothetical protein
MTLTDTQRAILDAAARHPERLCTPPGRLPAAARQAVAKALIRQGLARDEHARAYNAREAWQIDGRTRLLRLTQAGLGAIGHDPEDGRAAEEPIPPCDSEEERAMRRAAILEAEIAAEEAALIAGEGQQAERRETPAEDGSLAEDLTLLDEALATPLPKPRPSLRAAARRVLDAWDDAENHRYDLADAMEALRAALAARPPRAAREGDAPRKPREGTKQEQVLAMLRREEGATIAQIREATGWQQHTVRGFFGGLEKRQGIEVKVLERIRQVGPNKEGAKGSFTIYHLPA